MSYETGFNKLYHWLHSGDSATIHIGGSAPPGLSLNEIIKLSTNAEATRAAFDFSDIDFNLGSSQGDVRLREMIAATYNQDLSHLSPDDIIVTNGTTGANHIVHQSLLKPGDHVICQYPMYGPCIDEPQYIGCDVSYLRLNPEHNWSLDLDEAERLIRPGKTRLLVLNNPVNPTGTHFASAVLSDVVALCKRYNVVLHCDEIFRPLFHVDEVPTSVVEHAALDYDNVVATSSLSKAYGLSGVRIGWIACRSPALRSSFMSYRLVSLASVSLIDEAIATEVLGPRVRPGILSKHLTMAQTNMRLIQAFVDAHQHVCDWVPPSAGAVGFIRIKDPHTGDPVDDVAFCRRFLESKNVLLSPGTICFGMGDLKDAVRGRVRVHFTTSTERLRKGLQMLGEFLETEANEAARLSLRSKL